MAEASGWYWDNYQYDWCCKYCGLRADHRIPLDGDPFDEPQFDFCPHCGMQMKENKDGNSSMQRLQA